MGLLLAALLCLGCADEIVPFVFQGAASTPVSADFPHDLARIPISAELDIAVRAEVAALAAGTGDSTVVELLTRRDDLVADIQRPESRDVAGNELYRRWRDEPTSFLWIAAAVRYDYLLHRRNDLDAMLASPELADTNAAAGAFAVGYRDYGQGSRGRHFRIAASRLDTLAITDRLELVPKLAMVLSHEGRHLEAVRLLMKHLPSARQAGGPRLSARYWYPIALDLQRADRLDDALHAVATGTVCADRAGVGPLSGRYRTLLARILTARREYDVALDHFAAAVDRGRRDGYHWVYLDAADRAASLSSSLNHPERALEFDHAALAHSLAGGDSLNAPRNMMNIADDFRKIGRLDSCLVYQKRAQGWVDAFDNRRNKAMMPMLRAEYFCQVGDYARADSLLQVAATRAPGGSIASEEAGILLGLIQQGLAMGQPSLAYRAIDRLEHLRPTLFDVRPDQDLVADFELATAAFLTTRGEFRAADAALARARNVVEAGDTGRRWAHERAAGRLALLRGDVASAVERFERCLELAVPIGDPEIMAQSRFQLGQALMTAGDHARARDLFGMTESDTTFGGSFRTRLSSLVFLGAAWTRTGEPDSALFALERARRLVTPYSPPDLKTLLSLELGRAHESLGRPDAARLAFADALNSLYRVDERAHLDELWIAHRTLRRDVGESAIENVLGRSEPDVKGRAIVRALKLASLTSSSPGLTLAQRSLGDQDLARIGSRDGCLAVYRLGRDIGRLWVGRNGSWTVHPLPGIEALIAAARPVLADAKQPARVVDAAALAQLGAMLLDPVADVWNEGERLTIVPDGILHNLPWAALPLPDGAAAVERGPIAVAAHLAALLHDQEVDAEPAPAERSLLAIGYDGDVDAGDRLRRAEQEARAVAADWPSDRVHLLTGEGAGWREAQIAGLAAVDVIHIASHAAVTEGLGSQSCLQLAQAGDPEPVSVDAIAGLDLHAELVFLSCCETGRRHASGSGVTDFAAAFLAAGARSVLTSSVRVDDEAGLAFARAFYARWHEGASPAEALCAAQRAMRRRDSMWRHPFYWAFYKIVG